MDQNFETPVVDESSETPETSFGKEIAKALAVSTAISAGVMAGFLVVGFAYGKFQELKDRRLEKKAAEALKAAETKED